jgi:hypothetical protein
MSKDQNQNVVTYSVGGVQDFTFDEAIRLYKTRYESYDDFYRNVITHPELEFFALKIKQFWDEVIPVSIQEVFLEKNAERRRAMFLCVGVEKLFNELQPELLDSQTIKKNNHRWNEHNEEYEEPIEDLYELYRIDREKLFPDVPTALDAYAVRCWCTTTRREYFIYVPFIAVYKRNWDNLKCIDTYDAIAGIAWTIVINITNPKRIFRQGDIIITEPNPDSSETEPYHLSKEEYLRLMYAET